MASSVEGLGKDGMPNILITGTPGEPYQSAESVVRGRKISCVCVSNTTCTYRHGEVPHCN